MFVRISSEEIINIELVEEIRICQDMIVITTAKTKYTVCDEYMNRIMEALEVYNRIRIGNNEIT